MEDLIMMSKEERHLTTLIRTYEDRIIRSKNVYEIDTIRQELMKMRVQLQKMQWQRNRAC